MHLNEDEQRRIIPLKVAIAEKFDRENWLELGLLTGCLNEVKGHQRLLRSWDFGDDDYPGHVLDMLVTMVSKSQGNIDVIENFVLDKAGGGVVLPGANGKKRVFFTPTIFEVPDAPVDPSLVAVMMPFDPGFSRVYTAIKAACAAAGLSCKRVDDIWEHSTIIQDVFSLIWRSSIVICDFSGRNPNVFYECGIAHTLGKTVVPIAQHKTDVPFDVQHHRYLGYLNNDEGLAELSTQLELRLAKLAGPIIPPGWSQS
ncbi:hypothetical protein [Tsuneonella sp. HG222]